MQVFPVSKSMATPNSLLDTAIAVQVTVAGRRLSFGLRIEHILWGVLLGASLGARLVSLDVRAMSHDESLHALYSYYLYDRGEYVHAPMMHGPLLFHANALVYVLLGVSDFTTRLLPALAGTLVTGSMWWYRRYLGMWGAWIAGLLLAVSPSLLFHSRYIRNDIYVVLFSLLWVYTLLRYIESGEVKWMMGMGLGMLAGFISKENHFITGLLLGLFGSGMAVASRFLPRPLFPQGHRFADVTVVMGLLVLPFLAPLVHLAVGWDPLDSSSTGLTRSGLTAGLIGLLALGSGILWFAYLRPQSWRTPFDAWSFAGLFLAFWFITEMFFSTFLTNPAGLVSGVVESLGYWIAQQEVQRGSQPWYYYLMLTALYEYLVLPAALAGGFLGVRALAPWFRNRHRYESAGNSLGLDLPQVFVLLLLWWSIGSWLAYTYAGERMPWLLTHMVTPMCLLGGYGTGRIVQRCKGSQWEATAIVMAMTAGILCWVWASLLLPFGGREIHAVRTTLQWIGAVVAGTGLIGGCGWYIVAQRKPAMPVLVLGVFVPLMLLTLRTSYLLNFVNFDYVSEYLTYAHGSPDIKQALAEIDEISQRLHGDRSIPIAYDHDNSWPMAWYFREYPNAQLYQEPDESLLAKPIVLAGPSRWEQVRPLLERNHVRRTYRLIWWPEESYKQWSRQTWAHWQNAEMRQRWKRIFFFREHSHLDLAQWPHRREFDLFVRRDLAPLVWAEALDIAPTNTGPLLAMTGTLPRLDFPGTSVIAGEFGGMPLAEPRSIRIASQGFRIVTDSGNHRVLILDRRNQLVLSVGSFCPLDSERQFLCLDPDGEGPQDLGDGQFNEPWGAVLSESGLLFVADTWNHRMQVFDLEGNFRMKWGAFGQQARLAPGEPVRFFGPRGVDVLPNGHVVVVDTGNKRLLQFNEEGKPMGEEGGLGPGPGHFDEPVDGWVNPRAGQLLVTDNWNRRIQLLTLSLDPLAEIGVLPDMWNSFHALHKPHVTAIPDFGIAVSDPENGRVVLFDVVGQPLGYLDQINVKSDSGLLPLGLAYDPQTAELLVVDGSSHRVLAFDLSQATELLHRR